MPKKYTKKNVGSPSQLIWWQNKCSSEEEALLKWNEFQRRGSEARSKKLRDLIESEGQWNNWTLVRPVQYTKPTKVLKVLVRCKCGDEQFISTGNLRTGKSTGCKLCIARRGEMNNRWSGYKDMPGTVFHRIRGSAKTRDIDFNITIEEVYDLFIKQERKCWFTGEKLTWKTASLDRIDSHKPYEITNVIWVHRDVNYMKHTFTLWKFIQRCNQIAEHRGKYGDPKQLLLGAFEDLWPTDKLPFKVLEK